MGKESTFYPWLAESPETKQSMAEQLLARSHVAAFITAWHNGIKCHQCHGTLILLEEFADQNECILSKYECKACELKYAHVTPKTNRIEFMLGDSYYWSWIEYANISPNNLFAH